MPDSTARFLDYWNLGYRRVIPITVPGCEVSPRSTLYGRPDDIGKAPGERGHDGLWRSFNWMAHETSEADLARWGAMGAGLGLRTGGGIVAVDIDSLDKQIVLQIIHVAREMLGETPVRIGRYPKSLLLYACSDEPPYQRIEFAPSEHDDPKKPPRVELLQLGKQFVAAGVHPATGKPYQWFDSSGERVEYPSKPSDLPSITAAQIDAFFQRLAEILPAAQPPTKSGDTSAAPRDQEALRGNPQLVAEAVRALPNTSALFPSYDDYVRVGAAIKGAMGGGGEDLFVEWAMKWGEAGEEHTPERISGDFKRIKPPYRLGSDWLYGQAAVHGGFNPARAWFSPIEDTPPNTGRFHLETLAEAAAKAATLSSKPLVKGLLDQGAASCVYGDSNVGKSLVVMDLCWHIAAGKRWGGLRTTQTEVLYIAAEGGGGIRKRAEALRRKYGESPADAGLVIMPQAIDLLRPDVDLKDLVALLKERPGIGLLVVDTVSRALAGGDENSSVDMGAFVKHVDALRAATGAHVLIIHHTGKDKAKGARGWSGMRAAIDTEIEIDEGHVVVTKQRDMDKDWSTGFVIEGVHLRVDEDGDSVKSATVRLTSRDDAQAVLEGRKPLPAMQAAILQLLDDDRAQNTTRLIAERLADSGFCGDVTSGRVSDELARLVEKKLLERRLEKGRMYVYWRAEMYGVGISEAKLFLRSSKYPQTASEGADVAVSIFN